MRRASILCGWLVPLVAVPAAVAAPAPRPTILSQPTGASTDRTPTLAWRGAPGAVFTWTLTRGGRTVVGPRRTRAQELRLPRLEDGTYTVVLLQTLPGSRRSAEVASRPFTIDTSPPAAPTWTQTPRSVTGAGLPEASWTGEEGGIFRIELRAGDDIAQTLETEERSITFSRLASGSYVLVVRQTDPAGNEGPAARAGFSVDRALPATLAISPAGPALVNRPPTFRISGPPGPTLAWSLDGPVTRSGTGAEVDLSGIVDGRYRLIARTIEQDGTESRAIATEFTLDRVAPGPPTATATAGLPGQGTAQVVWSGEPGGRLRWELLADGARVRGPDVVERSPLSLAGLPGGAYTLRLAQLDPAGNASAPVNLALRIDDSPAEAVAPTSPRAGPAVLPRGVTRPVAGAIVERTRPLLRWRVPGGGVRPYAYNVQLYRERAKVYSGFSRTNLLRLPDDVLVGGARYYWQVWAFDAERRAYRERPTAIGWFDTAPDLLSG